MTHIKLPLTIALALAAVPAAAQDPYDRDPRLVIRERVRDVVRKEELAKRAGAYQGRNRGPEQTERFSRKVRIGRDGRLSLDNIAGNIVVTGGSGDEASIEAVKRTTGDASQLASVHIEVEERPGRVDIKTEHTARNDRVSVDYTVTVPAAAGVSLKSISGNVRVTGVQGPVRAESISGAVTAASTPRLELAKSVSGDVDLTDTSADAELNASSISGSVRAKGLKARALDLGTVSGDVVLTNVACERISIRSVSGDVEYSGTLARNGRYEINSHSGTVRLALSSDIGFELNANSFSGSIRSDLPLTLGATSQGNERRRGPMQHATRGVFGDGSATLTIRTFSGDVVITKR
jgi:DUF4097 and DUF4098 domain-containing protein YvlB